MATATPTVFIVDDDPQVCESLSLVVNGMGFEARAYASAEAFLDGCHDMPISPKCMILDVRMPGLSGLGLQQMLAAKTPRMPIIMISGCADIPVAVQAMAPGALDFLEKPFNSRALLRRIQEAIDQDVNARHQYVRKAELEARIEKLSSRSARCSGFCWLESIRSRSPASSASARRRSPSTGPACWKRCRLTASWNSCG